MPGSLSHLARRFFDTLFARPLGQDERALVESRLDAPIAFLFFEQPAIDQRHGFEAALYVMAAGEFTDDVVNAALLHDVGKRHAGLGVIGRTVATVLIKAGLPLTARMKAYRDHGETASIELARLGATPLAVDFALSHHGGRPDAIDERTWAVLQAADGNQSRSTGPGQG